MIDEGIIAPPVLRHESGAERPLREADHTKLFSYDISPPDCKPGDERPLREADLMKNGESDIAPSDPRPGRSEGGPEDEVLCVRLQANHRRVAAAEVRRRADAEREEQSTFG